MLPWPGGSWKIGRMLYFATSRVADRLGLAADDKGAASYRPRLMVA
jgi:hypothetical protein